MARILVIDDSELDRRLMKRMLGNLGYDVVTVSSARAGLKEHTRGPFDVVITDIMMPGQDGIETLMVFRRKHSVPVIAVSGGPYLEAARDLGAVAVLSKPLKKPTLATAIEQALSGPEESGGRTRSRS